VPVSTRARVHEDRGGDPLDGLVNLFDLGIVLAVAFLLAALSSVDLEEVFTDQDALQQAQAAASVTASEDEVVSEVELAPGERVVGQGEEIGTVYELNDGRTVIVRPEDSSPVPGEGAPVAPEGEEIAPEGTAPEDPVAPDGGSVPEIELEPPE
jgi:hypothetical protein